MLTRTQLENQIASIRAQAADFLIDSANLYRFINTFYEKGELRKLYANPILIQCRLIVRSGSESSNVAAQPRQVQQTSYTSLYRMQIPYDLEVNIGDQIGITDNVSNVEKRLDVIFVPIKNAYTGAVVIQLQEVQ